MVAEAEFALDKPDQHGLTLRQRNTISENAGQIDSGWRPDPPPEELLAVWRQYQEIHIWRGTVSVEMFDAEKKQHIRKSVPRQMDLQMISAWSQLTDSKIGPFEISVFAQLEAAFWRVHHGKAGEVDESQFLSTAKIKSQLRSLVGTKKDTGMRTITVKPKKR